MGPWSDPAPQTVQAGRETGPGCTLANMSRASGALTPPTVDTAGGANSPGWTPASTPTLTSSVWHTLPAAAGVALAYGVTAAIGHALSFPGASVSAMWMPNAILLAVLLLTPRRTWWIYLAAVLPAHLLVQLWLEGLPPARVGLSYVTNCGTALIGALAMSAYAPELRPSTVCRRRLHSSCLRGCWRRLPPAC